MYCEISSGVRLDVVCRLYWGLLSFLRFVRRNGACV